MADTDNLKWHEKINTDNKIDIDKLPKIKRPFDIIGFISKKKFDTKQDIEVLSGCGDQIAGFIGSGILNQNDLIDVSGTYNVLGYCCNSFKTDTHKKIISTVSTGIDDLYYQIGVAGPSGYIWGWFINNFKYKPDILFENYNGSKGLLFIPYIGGRLQHPEPYYCGTWLYIKYDHKIEHFYASLLESMSYELDKFFLHIKKLNNLNHENIKNIKVIGGGSRDRFWSNIKSNILNLKYHVAEYQSYELIGLFLIAKYKNKIKEGYKEYSQNRKNIMEVIYPKKEKVESFNKLKTIYSVIIDDISNVYKKHL